MQRIIHGGVCIIKYKEPNRAFTFVFICLMDHYDWLWRTIHFLTAAAGLCYVCPLIALSPNMA